MQRQVFAFAEFTFDSATGTLTRRNRGLRLPEQTARLLAVLLERPNSLVTRDELRQALWPDAEFLDYDQGINVAVNRLRNALRDDPRRPRYLKTIPKRGYSFCGEVTVVMVAAAGLIPLAAELEETVPEMAEAAETADLAAPAGSLVVDAPAAPTIVEAPGAAAVSRRSRWPVWLGASLAMAAMVGAGIPMYRARRPNLAPATVRLGIAPVRMEGGTAAGDPGDGFRLELSDAIAKLPHVQVSAVGMFTTLNTGDIPRLTRELRLDEMLLGSISRQGSEYDLRFELVRAADATHLASFEYSGTEKDLLSIGSRLQQDLFHYLQSGPATVQAINGSTNDARAYELYLEGAYHMYERNPDSLNVALGEFRQATARDPNFAAALAGMATVYLRLSAYDKSPSSDNFGKAEALAEQAIRLDPLLAQAHAVFGYAAYKKDRDFSRGESELRKAIRMDPSQAAYHNWLAVLLVEEGRFDEAQAETAAAEADAPAWPAVYSIESLVGVYARREAMAIAAAQKYVSLLPDLPMPHNTMAWVYFETGHYREAIGEWRQMAMLQNDTARVALEDRGLEALKAKGIRGYAQVRLEAIRSRTGTSEVNDFSPAEWYACAGEESQAVTELERLAAQNDPFLLHVAVDPLFDSLHHDRQFEALLAKSGMMIPPALERVNSHLCQ